MVERQKLRGVVLNEIYKTMIKYNIKFIKEKNKKEVLQSLESLVKRSNQNMTKYNNRINKRIAV